MSNNILEKAREYLRAVFHHSAPPPTVGPEAPPADALSVVDRPLAIEMDKAEYEIHRLGPTPEASFDEVKQLIAAGQIDDALRRVEDIDFINVSNLLSARFHDFSPRERLVYTEARHIVLATPQAVVSLVRAVEYLVSNDIPGAFVECGVYRGGSVMAMIRTLMLLGRTDRDIYLFDTFEGMPKPEDKDVLYTGEAASIAWKQMERVGVENGSDWVYATLEEVRGRILGMGYPEHRLHFVQGLVEDTLPAHAPENIALLRLDTDFYSSTKHELVHLFPRLATKGVLIIDDYGAFEGAKMATDEYIQDNKLLLLLTRADEHVRVAIK